MDLSLMILIDGSIIIVVGLLFCFFGFKLSRLLFPLPAMMLIESLVYVFLYGSMSLDTLGTWLFFGGLSVALYIALFFIPRIAGFFTGLSGSALLLFFIVNAAGINSADLIYAVCLTVSVLSGLLTVVYNKYAAIVFSSVFGACIAVFAGMYIFLNGVGTAGIESSENILAFLLGFLKSNALLLAGASAALSIAGILIQKLLTSHSKVLPGRPEAYFSARRTNSKYTTPDEPQF